MSQYVTKEYYYDEFGGKTILPDEIDKYLKLASEKIDSITFNRIVAISFDKLTEFQKEKIERAICFQAEYIYSNGYNNESNQEVASYSVLDISVNVGDKTKTEAEKQNMSEVAYDLIKMTGLTSRLL